MRRFIKDNKGMTLIELIIAVTILGFVATPLLHGFLTSAQTEVKARKLGEVTSVAQNVMEAVEGNTFEEAVKLETYAGSGQYYSVVDGAYTMPASTHPGGDDYHLGLSSYPVNGKFYDVMLDISASGYSQLNNNDKLSVNSKMNAIFRVQKTDVSADSKIIIDVTRITTDAGNAAIKFAVSHALGTAQPGTPEEYTYVIPANGDNAAIYLMYFPSYKRSETGTGYDYARDIIEINNLQDVEFDLFLIKQKDNAFTNAELEAIEISAKCDVIQKLSGTYLSANSISGATIYSNVKENLGDDMQAVPTANVTYKIMCGAGQGTELNGDILPFQTKEEARKRIYQVTVKVYDRSTGFTGEPIGTLTGAILK